MQTRNPFFDDLSKMANGAMGALSGVKGEMETRVRDQIAKILDGMDIPRRDEFEAVKAMAAAGAKLGLSAEMAMQLARATVAGSGDLLRQSSEPASQLRVNVTSPGGTTAEALKVLMATDGLQPVFDRALAAASRRSKELAG